MSLPGMSGTHVAWLAAGLLIAIGLLVGGRWVYRKFRKRRVWATINAEREDNKGRFMRSAESFAAVAVQLKTNAALLEPLHARSGIPQAGLAGQLAWNCDLPAFVDTAWQAIRRDGSTSLMQPHELREVEELYTDFEILRISMAKMHQEIEAASRHARAGFSDAGSRWLAEEVELLQAIRAAHEKLGEDMRHFHRQHTDFLPSV